jgi:hypothetical protein
MRQSYSPAARHQPAREYESRIAELGIEAESMIQIGFGLSVSLLFQVQKGSFVKRLTVPGIKIDHDAEVGKGLLAIPLGRMDQGANPIRFLAFRVDSDRVVEVC